MRGFRWTALALCALLLTGCAAREEETGKELYRDITGMPGNTVLLTAEGRKIPAWRYCYWLAYDCDYLTDVCDAEGQALEWSGERNGVPLTQYVKNQARDTTVLYAVIENWAEQYGCGITDEDQTAMEAEWKSLCARYGGEERCLGELAWMGLDREAAGAFTADYYRYGKLLELAVTPGSELYPAEELSAFAESGDYRTVDTIFISTAGVPKDDEAALAEKRERAELALSKLESSAAPAEYFSTLAGMYSDAGREDCPEGVTFSPGDGRVSGAVERASAELGENQWSGVVEVPGGLAILLRRPLDETAVAADWFDSRLQQAAVSAKVEYTHEYEEIDPAEFYAALTSTREQLNRSGATQSAFGPSDGELSAK